eukprot:gene15628-biopygen18724
MPSSRRSEAREESPAQQGVLRPEKCPAHGVLMPDTDQSKMPSKWRAEATKSSSARRAEVRALQRHAAPGGPKQISYRRHENRGGAG